jgi:ribosomal-protein-alanine N-acetyltransferase
METMRHFRVHIRWMIHGDMPSVLQIERASFGHPWTEEDFRNRLTQRNCIGMVAETKTTAGFKVIGFMVYELCEERLDLINLAVHPDYRLDGVGSQMTAKLASKLSSHRRRGIRLHVRESNLPAQLFFRGQGYRAIKIERGYHEDSGEDAYLFQFKVGAGVMEESK